MADWIWIPFGVVSGVSRGTGVLDGGGDHQRGRRSFGGKCGPCICSQWDSLREGQQHGSSQITLGFLVVIVLLLLLLLLTCDSELANCY